ncbi:MAG TPA: hypothetical protein VLR46_14415 [Candidatus Dormibacteraeota bacterium]|nr:hypothetical protein [Candidatus Dormibacteraeota bacterium]
MSDPQPYPPPPSGPPEELAPAIPAPDYAPVPAYGAPASGAYQSGTPYRVSRNLWVVITTLVVVVLLVVGAIGYVVAGYVFASSRISDAGAAIGATSSHRSYVNTTFDLLDQQVGSLDTTPDTTQGEATSGQLVSESQGLTITAGGDDVTLGSARSRLNDQQWLTSLSHGRMAAAAGHVDHARKAVESIKSAAGDYLLLGQFFQAFFHSLIDGTTMLTDVKNNDLVGSVSAVSAFQADLAKAVKLANAPGLPPQYRDFIVALQAYAADFAKELNARDKATYDAAVASVSADVAKVNTINFAGSTASIQSYYKHFRDSYNSEIAQASG